LNDVLTEGPVPAHEIIHDAEDAGIAEKTLRRAKKLLGVVAYRESEAGERRGVGRWLWKLPTLTFCKPGPGVFAHPRGHFFDLTLSSIQRLS
jgi:hypothetical protein